MDKGTINTILAKSTGETLSEHTIECLKASQVLIDSLPISEDKMKVLRNDVFLAVAMHDVGKAATGFQKVLRDEQKNWQRKRHEIISASFASGIEGISPAVIFAILTSHKSIPSDFIAHSSGCLLWEQIPFVWSETNVWKEMANEWKQNVIPFMEEWNKICDYLSRNITFGELKPLSLQPAWLESNYGKKGQRQSIPFQDRYYASIVRGLTIASDHLGSAKKIPTKIPELSRFSVIKQNPRPFQELIGKIEGSAILRAPTGSGKTEAALLWSQKNQRRNGRLFYILPYTASINAMHQRLAKIFGDRYVGILHHRATSALYSMFEAEADIVSRLDKQHIAKTLTELAHEIWFPIRVCTPHQILRYTLRGKGWEYMLAEFPNACFIFDEIHAYDPRVIGLTLRSAKLATQWGARCLFLSATLPAFLRKLITENIENVPFIEPNPEQDEDKKILDKKRHIVEIKDGSIKDHIETIIQTIRNCSSTLIVCNHVRTSQEIYSLLKERLQGEDIKLLHGRFNQEDRNRIEDGIINKSLPKVLVATQVVEVSLDVDFGQAFFEPAPIDALIQRMGRVNRSGKKPPAKVIIFMEQVNSFNLYCECSDESHKPTCRVKLTIEELQKIENPISEKDLVEAADRVYGEGYQGEDKTKFEEGFNHPDLAEFEEHFLAGAYRGWVEDLIEKTDGVIEVLPKCLIREYKKREEDGLWIEANSLLVPVREKSLAWLKPKIDMSNDPWIANLSYTSDKGLEIKK
ncbi:CRISPR-associated nuclease/helicase Cas3 [Methanosarcinales archaeon]|nr:CRISPR-associated helicase Cas3' [Candidatus Methanoperedens sp.]CAG0995991.1 CRISPR-associated nuclease/helicase Cas3 [Methanosarcinales archaeon]